MGEHETALQYVIDYLKRQIDQLDRMGQRPIRDKFLAMYQEKVRLLEEMRDAAILLDKLGTFEIRHMDGIPEYLSEHPDNAHTDTCGCLTFAELRQELGRTSNHSVQDGGV